MTKNNEKNQDKTHIYMFIEWISSIAVFISCFMFLFYRIDKMESHIKELSIQQTNKSDQQSARTDKLYEMFIDVLKENRRN